MVPMSLTGRSLGAIAFGLFVGAWLGRALFVWVLDLSRAWEIAAVVGCALVGAALGVAGAVQEGGKRQRAND
jgi:hypothetical protein